LAHSLIHSVEGVVWV